MDISKSHLCYSDCGSYRVFLAEGHQLPWSFFRVWESSHISALLCSSRPAGDSLRHPESKQLLPCEAGGETESRFAEAGTRFRRGKTRAVFHSRPSAFPVGARFRMDHQQQTHLNMSSFCWCCHTVSALILWSNSNRPIFNLKSIWEKVHTEACKHIHKKLLTNQYEELFMVTTTPCL